MTTEMSYTIDHVQMLKAENEKLQAQVAMLRGTIECVSAYCTDGDAVIELERALSATDSNWITRHDQQVRDEAYAAIGITKADEEQFRRIMQMWEKAR